MEDQRRTLLDLGWSDWFERRAEYRPTDPVAWVAAVDRGQCLLIGQCGSFRANPTEGGETLPSGCPRAPGRMPDAGRLTGVRAGADADQLSDMTSGATRICSGCISRR